MGSSLINYVKDGVSLATASYTMSNSYDYKLSTSSTMSLSAILASVKLDAGLSSKCKVSTDVTFSYSKPIKKFEKFYDCYKLVRSNVGVCSCLYGDNITYFAHGTMNLNAAVSFTYISQKGDTNTSATVAATIATALATSSSVYFASSGTATVISASVAVISALTATITALAAANVTATTTQVAAQSNADIGDPDASIVMLSSKEINHKSASDIDISLASEVAKLGITSSSLSIAGNTCVKINVGENTSINLGANSIEITTGNDSKIQLTDTSISIAQGERNLTLQSDGITGTCGNSSLTITSAKFAYGSSFEEDNDGSYSLG